MEEVAFLLGPSGGVVLGPVALLVMVVSAIVRRRKWPILVGGALALVLAVSTWIYWRAFWIGWDHAVANRPTPDRIQFVEMGSLTAAALACIGLMIGAVLAGRSGRKVVEP